MSKMKGAIVVDTDRCKGCMLCVVVSGYSYAESIHPDDCVGCAACGIVCPDGCITVYRTKEEKG